MLRLINPWFVLAALIALASAGSAGYIKGSKDQRRAHIAEIAEQQTLAEQLEQTIATEVGKIKITNTYVRGKIETITREVPVYRECVHDPRVVSLLNDILAGKASVATGQSVVPAADAAP